MKMEDCKKYDSCSAPICPLDPDYKLRVHLAADRVCLYLREYSKTVTRCDLRGAIPDEQLDLVGIVYLDIEMREKGDKLGQLKRSIINASKTPSKLFGKSMENLI